MFDDGQSGDDMIDGTLVEGGNGSAVLAALAKVAEVKSGPIRHVRTPEGVEKYKAPVGTPIVAHPDLPSRLTPTQETGLDALRTHPVNRQLGDAFATAGHSLFLVGGSVRDALAGQPDFADLDYTTDATPDEIHAIVDDLGPVWTIGEEFGTVAVQLQGLKTEITTFRTERYDPDSRKPVVAFGDNIADDLKRRDLTMNASALTIASDGTYPVGSLVDPHNGADDLAAGVLRTPDDPMKSMSEDPLRQLRVVRFAAKRNATPEAGLKAAVRSLRDRLDIVALERKTAELRKILEGGPAVTSRAMGLANDLGVSPHLFGGLDTTSATAAIVDRLPADADPTTILAALAAGRLRSGSTGPEVGAALVDMRLSTDEIRPALTAAHLVLQLTDPESPADPATARALVRDNTPETLARAFLLADALRPSRSQTPPLRAAVGAVVDNEQDAVRAPFPVDGNDMLELGLRGPEVGAALARVRDAFLADPQLGRAAALAIATQIPADDRTPIPNPDPDLDLGDLAKMTAALSGPPSPDGRPKAVIFDRDGTLASVPKAPTPTVTDNGHTRPATPGAWAEYNAALPFDRPVPRVVALLKAVPPGVVRIMTSGRAEGDWPGDRRRRFAMQDWIVKHQLPIDELYMRTGGDMRRDSIVKEEILTTEILDKFDVRFAVDDRAQVVEVWERYNIPTLQVVGPDLGFPIADQTQEDKAGVRHVRTPEGVRQYRQPIGTPIVARPRRRRPPTPLDQPLTATFHAKYDAVRSTLPDSSATWFDSVGLSSFDPQWRKMSNGPGPRSLETESAIRAIGKVVDDEVERRIKAAWIDRPLTDAQMERLRKQRDPIFREYNDRKWDLMTSVSMELFGVDWTDLEEDPQTPDSPGIKRSSKVAAVINTIHERNPEIAELGRKDSELLDRLITPARPYYTAYATALASVLGQLRPMGGKFDARAKIDGRYEAVDDVAAGPNSGVIPYQWRHVGPWDTRIPRPVNIDRVGLRDYNNLDPQTQKQARIALRKLERGETPIAPKQRGALVGTYSVKLDNEARMLVYPHVDGTWHIYAFIPHHDYHEAERRMADRPDIRRERVAAGPGTLVAPPLDDPTILRTALAMKKVAEAQDVIATVARHYPTSWIDRSNDGKSFFIGQSPTGRGYYQAKGNPNMADGLFLGNDLSSQSVAIHELAHRMERMNRTLTAAEWAFYWRRTMEKDFKRPDGTIRYGIQEHAQKMSVLRPDGAYEDHEVARPDKFVDPYVGKDYGDGPDSMYEVLSMGMEGVWTGSQPMYRDNEHRQLIVGLLAAA